MLKIAAIASLVILSNGFTKVAQVPQVKPQNAQLILAHGAVSPSKLADTALQNPVDILNEAKKALNINDRRNQMKPGIQDRVVEKEKKKHDKVLIMGGAEAFPM